MRAGMQSLLDLLRGRLQHVLDAAEWSALLTVAEQENVLQWACDRLLLLDRQHTPERTQQLSAIRREAQVSTFVWTETLKIILAAYRQADLPVISLKGPCMAERFYGAAALRTCYDLDLLVRKSDLVRAERLLTGIGFLPDGDADDYHRRWRRKPIVVELHHHVENQHAFQFDLDAIWARAAISQFQGVPIRLLDPSDELLYLCLHAVHHRFERLYLMLDLGFAFRQLPLNSAWANEWSDPIFKRIVALGSMMAARLDPQISMPADLRLHPEDRSRLDRLADRLWSERMNEPASVLDWDAQHRFYLEIERPGWSRFRRRYRHSRILMTRLIQADFAFAGRFNLHRDWQVRLLRPIRLLVKALGPSPRVL